MKCEVCGAKMVLRTNGKTKVKFWGCSTFPKCKVTYQTKEEYERFRESWIGAEIGEDGELYDSLRPY